MIEIPERLYHLFHNDRFLEKEESDKYRLFEKNENNWIIIKICLYDDYITVFKLKDNIEINQNIYDLKFYNDNTKIVTDYIYTLTKTKKW